MKGTGTQTETFVLTSHPVLFAYFTQQTFNALPRSTLHSFPAADLKEKEQFAPEAVQKAAKERAVRLANNH